MKRWHVLVLAGNILGCCGIIAAALSSAPRERYHYSDISIDNRLTRIDKDTGKVQVWDAERQWHDR